MKHHNSTRTHKTLKPLFRPDRFRILAGLLAVAAWLLMPGRAAAATLLEDAFGYADGNLAGVPGSPWVAHSGAGNGPVQAAGGQLLLTGDGAEDVHAVLQGAPYPIEGETPRLYARFTLRCTALPSNAGAYFAHFRSGTAQRARVWISRANAAEGHYRLGIGNSTGANAESGQIPVDLSLGEDYEVVLRYELSTGQSSIGLGLNAEAEMTVTATDPVGLTTIEDFAWRQAGGVGSLEIDDLTVTDTFPSRGVRLRVGVEAGQLVLRWPAAETEYGLQSTRVLGEGSWRDEEAPGEEEGADWVVRYALEPPARYFRLIQLAP